MSPSLPRNCSGLLDPSDVWECLDTDTYFKGLMYPDVMPVSSMLLSPDGLNCVKNKEYFDPVMYNDGNNPITEPELYYDRTGKGSGSCTIGYGIRIHPEACNINKCKSLERPYENGMSRSSAEYYLINYIDFTVKNLIDSTVIISLTQKQYDAITSLLYNWNADSWKSSLHLKC